MINNNVMVSIGGVAAVAYAFL